MCVVAKRRRAVFKSFHVFYPPCLHAETLRVVLNDVSLMFEALAVYANIAGLVSPTSSREHEFYSVFRPNFGPNEDPLTDPSDFVSTLCAEMRGD